MKALDCCITFVFPSSLEDTVVEHLLEHSELVPAFSTVHLSGHGRDLHAVDAGELVRGRVSRTQVEIVMNREDAARLVASLRTRLPNPEITYWVTPVSDCGRLA